MCVYCLDMGAIAVSIDTYRKRINRRLKEWNCKQDNYYNHSFFSMGGFMGDCCEFGLNWMESVSGGNCSIKPVINWSLL